MFYFFAKHGRKTLQLLLYHFKLKYLVMNNIIIEQNVLDWQIEGAIFARQKCCFQRRIRTLLPIISNFWREKGILFENFRNIFSEERVHNTPLHGEFCGERVDFCIKIHQLCEEIPGLPPLITNLFYQNNRAFVEKDNIS